MRDYSKHGMMLARAAQCNGILNEFYQFLKQLPGMDEESAIIMMRAQMPHMANRMQEIAENSPNQVDFGLLEQMRKAPILPHDEVIELAAEVLDLVIQAMDILVNIDEQRNKT